MSGVSKIIINEESDALRSRMSQEKALAKRERLHALYLLKSGEAKSITQAARILGRNRTTVQRWMVRYEQDGLEGLLTLRPTGHRQAAIPPWAQDKLKARLQQPRGFSQYGEIVQWLKSECGITVNYWVVYDLVRRRWGAKPKSARPRNVNQDPDEVEHFVERLAETLRVSVKVAPDLHLRFWVEDESRFGLKPITRKRITARGVPPIAQHHWRFEWVWLYGFLEPLTGESFFFECLALEHQCFGMVLDAFSKTYGEEDMHIIQLDRSAVHRTPKLQMPSNVAFCFQPAYSPELNPIEQLWRELKGQLSNQYWFDLAELQREISHQLRQLTRASVRSLTQRYSLMEALDFAGVQPKPLTYSMLY